MGKADGFGKPVLRGMERSSLGCRTTVIGGGSIAVNVTGDSERLVRLDPRLTAAALSHLLENAAQYSPPAAPIAVHAAVTGEGLTISVRDHGPGIPLADLPRVFDRFHRGANVRDRRSGTGMGLAIAKGLLAIERGRIAADNCPDGGARFTVAVPAEVK